MSHPPRLAHLATLRVLVAKLAPTYADAHRLDLEEATLALERALSGRLREDLLDACWTALRASRRRGTDEELLEKVAESVKLRGLREGKCVPVTKEWSAFLVLADLEAGTASDAARRVFESDEGRKMAAAGLAAAGAHLARELLRT